jgi:transforming growth factor-beta-induced protein
MKRLTLLSLLLIFTLALATCGASETPAPAALMAEPTAEMEMETSNTIVDIAVANGRFNTLVAAVTAAGLVDTLSGEGPFTVFAPPTDDTFAALPDGTAVNTVFRNQ